MRVHRKGTGLFLRELTEDDRGPLLEMMGDPQVMGPYGKPALDSAGVDEYIAQAALERAATPRRHYRLAALRDGETACRTVVTLDLDQRGGAMAGVFQSRLVWSEGRALAAMHLLFDFAFDDLRLHRIWACHDDDNKRSETGARRLGMTFEGCMREVAFANGRWVSSVLYSILDREWSASRSA